MTIPHYPVVIIGGGPGGLSLAQGLKKNGISFRIYEKSAVRDDYVQGFRLRIRDRGLDALRQNLPDHLWQAFNDTLGAAPASNILLGQDLLPIREPIAPAATSADDDTHAEKSVSRITLRQILLSGLEDDLEIGRAYLRYEETPDGVLAHFEDGHVVRADLLVGADGANSRVRAQLSPDASSIDTGVRRVAGKMTLAAAARHGIPAVLLDHTVHVRPREGRSIMITSHRVNPAAFADHGLIGRDDASHAHIDGFHFDNTTSYVWWNTAYRTDELAGDAELAALDGAGLIDAVLGRIPGWHRGLRDLIAKSDPSTVALLKVRSSVPGKDWPTGRVTLLGDSAHAMTYFRALGANTALYDSGLLVRALVAAARGEVARDKALADYESAMRDHGYEAVRTSLSAMLRTIQPLPAAAVAAE